MPKSLLVQIEPAILKYARKYSGFSLEEAANKNKISTNKLQEYEDQKSDIPLSHLEKFAVAYKRPLAFFLLSQVPSDAVEPKDFRIVYTSENELNFSPSEYLAIRRARYVQSTIAELADEKFDYKLPSISIQSDSEELGGWFRNYIGVELKTQHGWNNPSVALRFWKNALEEKNIFILQHSLPKDDISGFCFVDKKPYIILLNTAEHEYRRIFSLFHEVGHILLHKSGICTPDDLSRNSYQYKQIEKFCNQFSASVLLPRGDFMADLDVIRMTQRPFSSWEDGELKEVARKFKVSKEVVLRKFLTLGYIKDQDYESRRKDWKKLSEEFKKPKKKELKIPQYLKALSQNGRGFTVFVLNQYHGNKISFSTAAEVLNLGPKHMARLEAQL